MKNVKSWIIAAIISISLALSACSDTTPSESASITPSPANTYNAEFQERTEQSDSSSETIQSPTSDSSDSQVPILENIDEFPETNEPQPISDISQNAFSVSDVSQYSGQSYITVNNNAPYFSEADLTTESFELYSDLDEYGRCGTAYANICIDIMPTEERGEIGQIRPSGWHNVKYNDIIDGNYLYNRCHLIGYQLAGENANEKNLITGTRYLNVQGMLPFENMVFDYVKETENHVLYRVTPIFEGDNLVASGVLMEAESVEDKGNGILFCVFVYNVQPGIIIDYASGESSLDEDVQAAQEATEEPKQSVPEATAQEITEPPKQFVQETMEPQVQVEIPSVKEQESVNNPEPQGTTYILNTNTKKFHYPSCSSVDQMKEKNKQVFTGNRDDVISQGYVPCKRCNP